MEESGSKVQLSQKPDGLNLQERVITLKGEKIQLITASNIITSKIKDDPQSASCPNISYAGITGPVANANPTGSPYAAAFAEVQTLTGQQLAAMIGQPVMSGLQAIPITAATQSQLVHGHTLQHAHHAPSVPGDVAAFNATVNSLANYGYAIGAGGSYNHHVGLAAASLIPTGSSGAALSPGNQFLTTGVPSLTDGMAYPATAAAAPMMISNNYLASMASAGYLTGHQIFSSNTAAQTCSMPTSTIAMSPSPIPATAVQVPNTAAHAASILSVEKSTDGLKETIDLSVPESLVGAILGKGGKTLVEYQEISGTRIQISKKGDYVPGTRNRRVSITGKPPGPQTAQILITQRLMTVQTARAQQAQVL